MSLLTGLSKTRLGFFGRLREFWTRPPAAREALFDELESLLIAADVGVPLTVELLDRLRTRASNEKWETMKPLADALKQELLALLPAAGGKAGPGLGAPADLITGPAPVRVLLLAGVNGAGKTTTLGKLAHRLRAQGEKVMIAAADTFRAAAPEQLSAWARRAGADLVRQAPGADPAAVAFDALRAARARGCGIVLIDTAGRLHTQANLMGELKKIRAAVSKQAPAASVGTYLVLDGTGGQNTLSQAREFNKAAEITGLVVTKLDGTAKGGFVFAICREIAVPIVFVGTGEGIDDLSPFDAGAFTEAFFAAG